MAERRIHPRALWVGAAQARIGQARAECRGVDLSECGMQFTGPWRATPGQATWIDFDLDERRVQARAVVVWSTPADGGFRWGIRFTALHSSSALVIANYVERGMIAAYQNAYRVPEDQFDESDEQATQLWTVETHGPPVGSTQIVSPQQPSSPHTQIVPMAHDGWPGQTSLQQPWQNGGVALPAFVPPPRQGQPAQDMSDLPLATSLGLDFGPPAPAAWPAQPSQAAWPPPPNHAPPVQAAPPPALHRAQAPVVVDLPDSYVGLAPTEDAPRVTDSPTGVGYLPPNQARVSTGVTSAPHFDPPTGLTQAPLASMATMEPSTDVEAPSVGHAQSGYESLHPERGSARPPDAHAELPPDPAPPANRPKSAMPRAELEALLASAKRRQPTPAEKAKAKAPEAPAAPAAPARRRGPPTELRDLYRAAVDDMS